MNKKVETCHKLRKHHKALMFCNLKSETRHKLLHNLKSQGMSVTVIIIAVVALIVLIVLIAIFTGRFGFFSKGLDECPGKCESASECKPPNVVMSQYACSSAISTSVAGGTKLSTGGYVCCVKLSK